MKHHYTALYRLFLRSNFNYPFHTTNLFLYSLKNQETKGFFIFSGVIESDKQQEMD